MTDLPPDPQQPLSLNELHEIRRKVLFEDYDPPPEEWTRIIQTIRVARPLPEDKKPKKRERKVPTVDLTDLIDS